MKTCNDKGELCWSPADGEPCAKCGDTDGWGSVGGTLLPVPAKPRFKAVMHVTVDATDCEPNQ